MTWSELTELLKSLAALFTPLILAYSIWVSRKNGQKIDVVHELAKQVQVETNGMKSELVEEVRRASFAKGVKSETDKGK
jgi:alpha-L-fucosidase